VRPRLSFANVASLLALVLAAGGVAFAAAGLVDGKGQIHGCVSKKNGRLRVVKKGTKCGKGQTKLVWSQKGPPGGPGKTGLRGPGARSLDLTYNGTTEKTVESSSGLKVTAACGGTGVVKIAPVTVGAFVLAHGYASQNGMAPFTIDDSGAYQSVDTSQSGTMSVIARASDATKWSKFDLGVARDAGGPTCEFRGLITPPS
jgi:hypothetical protein